jgi:hypothetical protein
VEVDCRGRIRVGQAESLHVPGSADRVQHDLRAELLPVHVHDEPPIVASDRLHLTTEDESRRGPPQALRECIGKLAVEERQQTSPAVDEGDLDAERGEDRGVLGADRAASDDQDPLGEPLEREHRLGVVDVGILERDVRGMVGPGPRCQQDHSCAKRPLPTLGVADDHASVGTEPRVTMDELDTVPVEVPADRRRHRPRHLRRARPEAIQHELGRERDPHPVDVAPRPAGQVDGRVPQSLHRHPRDRDRPAPSLGAPLDHGHPIPVIGRLIGTLLAGCTRADHDEVEAVGVAPSREPGHGDRLPSCEIGWLAMNSSPAS